MKPEQKLPIKQALKAELEKPGLDERQLAELMQLQTASQPAPADRFSWRHINAVALLLLMLGLGFWLGGYQQPPAAADIPGLIAYEVASQHLKNKPMDMQTSHFSQLVNYFTELDFKPFAGPLWQGELMGGRYCSLRTVPAAQIRYHDQQGVRQTLYETEYSEAYFADLPDIGAGQAPLIRAAKGVEVAIWVDKGIVFAATLDK